MIGVYFSGTGNTKYCLEKFVSMYDDSAKIVALENDCSAEKIKYHQDIVFAYPIYYSSLPKIVSDFIKENYSLWKDKNIFIIATMGLFSGDGTGVGARLMQKYKAHIIGGLHLRMPDSICDIKLLKRSNSQNKELVNKANHKIQSAVTQLKKGKPTKEGLNVFCHIAGLLGQRMWFYGKTRHYYENVRINTTACTGCGKCIAICPMKNLSLSQNKAEAGNRCTLCYRCVNQCTEKAITILGKQVISQHSINDFL